MDTEINNYLNENLIKNRSKERMDKFGDAPIEYSVLAATTATNLSIKKDINTTNSEKELNEFAPLTAAADYKIDESKTNSGVYLIQTWAKKVCCKRASCMHIWYYRGKNDHTICPKCRTSVDVIKQMVKN